MDFGVALSSWVVCFVALETGYSRLVVYLAGVGAVMFASVIQDLMQH